MFQHIWGNSQALGNPCFTLVTSFPIVYTSTIAPRMCSTARRRRTKRIVDPEAPKDFFISYTHADQRWAEWIAWQLESEGYTTRIQAWDFLAGSNFVHEMDMAAKQATRTIAVLSPDYFTSHFTSSEWEAAFVRDPRGRPGPARACAGATLRCGGITETGGVYRPGRSE